MAWSPDGRHVFFVRGSGKDGMRELWRLPVQGGEPQKIGLEDAYISSPSFSPDGRRLAFDAGFMEWTRRELWEMENFLPGSSAGRTGKEGVRLLENFLPKPKAPVSKK